MTMQKKKGTKVHEIHPETGPEGLGINMREKPRRRDHKEFPATGRIMKTSRGNMEEGG